MNEAEKSYEDFGAVLADMVKTDPTLRAYLKQLGEQTHAVRKRITALTRQMMVDEKIDLPLVVNALVMDAVVSMVSFYYGDRAKARDSLSILLDEKLDEIDRHLDKHGIRPVLAQAKIMAANGDTAGATKMVREFNLGEKL